jgi:TRAP-type C4-dicarboxylate transport system permease small subunit
MAKRRGREENGRAKRGKPSGERAEAQGPDSEKNGERGESGAPPEPAAKVAPPPEEPAAATPPPPESPRKSASPASATSPAGAAWGEPIARFEGRVTRFETKLITFVLLWQLAALVSWVILAGMSAPPGSGSSAGLVFRGAIGAVALGCLGYFATTRASLNVRRAAAVSGLVVGLAIAGSWRAVGVDYFDNVKGWLQEGSTLTLMGGLRGLATRLTLWLALLGASLATAAGKHIHVDVIFRFLPVRLRKPAAVVNYCAAAIVCLAAVWGFFDHIAIENFGAKADAPGGDKISIVAHHMERHAFLTSKQLGLDLRTLPHVIAGERYDRWMPSAEWNQWVQEAGFEEHYAPDEVKNLLGPAGGPARVPLVVAPDGEITRGVLIHTLNMVFPFGLLMIGLRFLIRALLAVSGHIDLDPNAAHAEDLHAAHRDGDDAALAEGGR